MSVKSWICIFLSTTCATFWMDSNSVPHRRVVIRGKINMASEVYCCLLAVVFYPDGHTLPPAAGRWDTEELQHQLHRGGSSPGPSADHALPAAAGREGRTGQRSPGEDTGAAFIDRAASGEAEWSREGESCESRLLSPVMWSSVTRSAQIMPNNTIVHGGSANAQTHFYTPSICN